MHPCWRVCGKNLNIVSMCVLSPIVHISNIYSCQNKLFQFSCGCEQFHWSRSFGFLVINVCNHGEHYETPWMIEPIFLYSMQPDDSFCYKFEFSYHSAERCNRNILYDLVTFPDLLDMSSSGAQNWRTLALHFVNLSYYSLSISLANCVTALIPAAVGRVAQWV